MGITVAKRSVINITDGSRRNFDDDGSDVDPNTGVIKQHRVRRSILLQAAEAVIAKGPHKGMKVFWAEEPFAPLFKGDPVVAFPVLDAKARKAMAELTAERDRFLNGSKAQADNEAVLALAAVKLGNTAAAQTPPPAKTDA